MSLTSLLICLLFSHCFTTRKEKLHLCPMHKHKLTGGEQQNKLETVAETEALTTGDCDSRQQVDCSRQSSRGSRLSTLAEASDCQLSTVTCEPPPEWASEPEKVKVVGEKVKVPPKSYKDVEFNL